MSKRGKNKRAKKIKKNCSAKVRRHGRNGCFVLGLWIVTLLFVAMVGIPIRRALLAGRHLHTNLSLVILVLVLVGASVTTTICWLRSKFGPPAQH